MESEVYLLGSRWVPGGKTGTFIKLKSNFSTPFYTLQTPAAVNSDGTALFIDYSSTGDSKAEIHFTSGKISSFILPSGDGNRIHYQFPVDKGLRISGFIIKDLSETGTGFKLFGSGLEKKGAGFYSEDQNTAKGVVTLSYGFQKKGAFAFSFKDLSQAIDQRISQVQIKLVYTYSGTIPHTANIFLSGIKKTVSHKVTVRPGGAPLYFYSDEEGFLPTGLHITEAGSGFKIKSLEIIPFSRYVSDNYKPVPGDIGVILSYKNSSWRRSDREIFSWNLFPDFLLIDFKDYSLQASFLKRLAFFLEKNGYTGKLLTNEKLKNLHGWNAHDYRAEDLALFYNRADEIGFVLNPEEYLLLDILINNNILRKENTGYIPVSGGFLAFSRESSDRLRYLFITHEGYHAVFFSSASYREDVQRIWDSLSDEEHSFWLVFLSWKGYNIQDPYLVVNEFQAYLMQQKLENVDSYYKNYIIPKLRQYFPEKTAEIDIFLEKYPDHFLRNAEKMQKAVSKVKGITAGELYCVR